LLIFCAQTELAVMHRSQYIVCDGTFEMAPDTAYQVQVQLYITGNNRLTDFSCRDFFYFYLSRPRFWSHYFYFYSSRSFDYFIQH